MRFLSMCGHPANLLRMYDRLKRRKRFTSSALALNCIVLF